MRHLNFSGRRGTGAWRLCRALAAVGGGIRMVPFGGEAFGGGI